MSWCILGIVAYPETLKRAREEIIRVVGWDKILTFDDFDHLPYIKAMAKEVLRWRHVALLGVPHRPMEDDTYEGHFFPARTILMSNIWSTYRDPLLFRLDTHEFNPLRFLTTYSKTGETIFVPAPSNTKGEHHVAFWFWRRTCMGSTSGVIARMWGRGRLI